MPLKNRDLMIFVAIVQVHLRQRKSGNGHLAIGQLEVKKMTRYEYTYFTSYISFTFNSR